MSQDDIEKIRTDELALQQRKKALIDELLKQKEAAMREFDKKLAQLGYHAAGVKPKRSHHKKVATAGEQKP